MKITKRTAALLIACVLVVIALCAVTLGGGDGAHSEAPKEGGKWEYGTSAGRTWSNFLHDAPHRATVQGHNFVDSGCIEGGSWARAQTGSQWISIIPNKSDKELCQD